MADKLGHTQHPLRRLAALLLVNSGHAISGVNCRSILGLFAIPKSDQLFKNVNRRFLSASFDLIAKRCVNEGEKDLS